VRGNHDIVDSALPLALDMRTIEEPWKIGSLALCHHPQDVETHYALAGHLHPAYRLLGRANERTRVPCFWFGPKRAVLPAFGAFTGCCVIQPGEGDEIYLAGPDRIHALPRRAAPA
jgi:metallophosphoesterase superfamily enzyme